ncbi:two-component system, NarL family, sensor kinase [Marinobacter gudaonensis]|uniref:histidine kinase n=1 Tax=Marinobacter gudaonensis TaxID=375760 RepID=A0A1I6I011_9GAMM|nr:cache domain-containing protein [Marinobacter gudaonensis]SFR59998.1 two-component system, NarL family, sensor kinase [Marinobacter gudaonensis]
MKKLTFKTKILIVSLLPLLVVSALLIVIAGYQAKQLGEKNIQSFTDTIFDLRRSEIENYTDIARTTLEYFSTSDFERDISAQELARNVLRNVSYGEDGYFFVYDHYTTLVNPSVPSLEGQDQRTLEDPNGVRLIQDLYKQAEAGGGYTDYAWLKPSRGRVVDKISYAAPVDKWDWWVGTGLYVDDLEDSILSIRSSVDNNILATLQIITGLAVGAVVLVGFVGARLTLSEGRLADVRLKNLSHKVVEGQEEERSRVAMALQKEILRPMNVMKSKLQSSELTKSLGETGRRDFNAALSALNDTMTAVHKLSGDLRPEALDEKGLFKALEDLVDQARLESGIEFSLVMSPRSQRLDSEIEIAVYRIAQEAIKNIVKHSGAEKSRIRLRVERNVLTLTIQDNGIGFDANTAFRKGENSGKGFVDMRVRAESQGGHLTVFSSNGTGAIVKAEIPVIQNS